MTTAREALAAVIDRETSERFALAETINVWLDGEGLDIEMDFPIFPLAVAILVSDWLKDHDKALKEGIATAIEADSIRQWGHVTAGARPYAAIARTYTQGAGE